MVCKHDSAPSQTLSVLATKSIRHSGLGREEKGRELVPLEVRQEVIEREERLFLNKFLLAYATDFI